MSLIILGDSFTFPEGDAATNRVYTYAKGFHENGLNVHIICFKSEYLNTLDGITAGIRYYHPFGQSRRSNYFLVRRWLSFQKYLKTFILIKKIREDQEIKAIILYSQVLLTQIFVFIIAKFLKTKMIIERSEHPFRNCSGKVISQILSQTKLAFEVKLCDGIFCISNYLIDFYCKKGVNRQKLFLVPSTVDTGRFEHYYSSPLPYQYILYCGSLTILKDGVDLLIESFAKISGKYPEINLVLVGEADSFDDEMIFKNLVMELKIDDRVLFCGKLPRTDIPAYLCNSKILALARPQSIIADAGFPSKLTEYLASGMPVIVTKVGEIPLYVKDNESVYLAEPGNVEKFAEKLDYVLSNYNSALRVGNKGKELTKSVFNYNFQAKRMIEFINKSYFQHAQIRNY